MKIDVYNTEKKLFNTKNLKEGESFYLINDVVELPLYSEDISCISLLHMADEIRYIDNNGFNNLMSILYKRTYSPFFLLYAESVFDNIELDFKKMFLSTLYIDYINYKSSSNQTNSIVSILDYILNNYSLPLEVIQKIRIQFMDIEPSILLDIKNKLFPLLNITVPSIISDHMSSLIPFDVLTRILSLFDNEDFTDIDKEVLETLQHSMIDYSLHTCTFQTIDCYFNVLKKIYYSDSISRNDFYGLIVSDTTCPTLLYFNVLVSDCLLLTEKTVEYIVELLNMHSALSDDDTLEKEYLERLIGSILSCNMYVFSNTFMPKVRSVLKLLMTYSDNIKYSYFTVALTYFCYLKDDYDEELNSLVRYFIVNDILSSYCTFSNVIQKYMSYNICIDDPDVMIRVDTFLKTNFNWDSLLLTKWITRLNVKDAFKLIMKYEICTCREDEFIRHLLNPVKYLDYILKAYVKYSYNSIILEVIEKVIKIYDIPSQKILKLMNKNKVSVNKAIDIVMKLDLSLSAENFLFS